MLADLEFLAPFAIVVAFSLLLSAVAAGKSGGKRRRRRSNVLKFRKPEPGRSPAKNWGMADPQNQLAAIAKVNFERTRIMNASEYRVFKTLEDLVAELGGKYRLMAQTSLGEVIRPVASQGSWKDRKDAYASINSKRLDFAIIDEHGLLALAVEYQGAGHHQKSAFIRDAVKKEALRRAKVPLIEVEKGTKPSELRQRVLNALCPKEAPVPQSDNRSLPAAE